MYISVSLRFSFCSAATPYAFTEPKEHTVSTEPRINDRIRTPQIRLIGHTGEQVGLVVHHLFGMQFNQAIIHKLEFLDSALSY